MPYILKAFWLPIRNIAQVVQIFWPLFLVALLVVSLSTILVIPGFKSPELASLVGFTGTVYLILLTASGLSNWHRTIIREEKPAGATFALTYNDIKYLGRMIILAISYVICLFGTVLIFGWVDDYNITSNSISILIVLVAILIFAVFWRNSVLILPAISDNQPYQSHDKQITKSTNTIAWPISIFAVLSTFLITSAIPFLVLATTALSPEDYPDAIESLTIMAVSLALTVLSLFYGALTFTALLSLFYREHIYIRRKKIRRSRYRA